jgi:hypothetical protein
MDMIPHVPTEARFYLLILFPTHINARIEKKESEYFIISYSPFSTSHILQDI